MRGAETVRMSWPILASTRGPASGFGDLAGVNCAATISRAFIAFLFLLPAAKLNHICAAV